MKQLLRIVGLALIAVIAGCAGTGGTQSADHQIVVTTNILGDVVRNVGNAQARFRWRAAKMAATPLPPKK